ncbi:MAG: hypothetical protein GMKNLPBB_02644 [Myxococcota bacterium]|nr:hypothetical protein [Myxococcota bacterium]
MPEIAPEIAEATPIRRLYFELVRWRRRHPGVMPLQAAARPEFHSVWRMLAQLHDGTGVQPRIAVLVELPDREHDTAGAIETLMSMKELRRGAVGLDLWLHLGCNRTRYLNHATAGQYLELAVPFARRISRLVRGSSPSPGVCLDAEPSQNVLAAANALRQVMNGQSRFSMAVLRDLNTVLMELTRNARMARRGLHAMKELRDGVLDAGLPLHTAVIPPLGDMRRYRMLRNWLLGAPVLLEDDQHLWPRACPMTYATLLGMMRPGVTASAEEEYLLRWLRLAWDGVKDQPGGPAIGLGQTSEGIIGNEPVYGSLFTLRRHVLLAESMGFPDISIFSLEGLLYGPPGEPAPGGYAPLLPGWMDGLRAACATDRTAAAAVSIKAAAP